MEEEGVCGSEKDGQMSSGYKVKSESGDWEGASVEEPSRILHIEHNFGVL